MNIVYYIHDVTSSDEFERLVRFLRSRYRFISPNEFRDFLIRRNSLNDACLLTIDDGWLSAYRIIFPLIQKYGIPAILFVSPAVCQEKWAYWFYLLRFCDESFIKKWLVDKKLFDSGIGRFPLDLLLKALPADVVSELLSDCLSDKIISLPRNFVNTQELLEMKASGWVEIGAHTMTHPILGLESDERAEREIVDSVRSLSELVGGPIRSFAYPNGIPLLDFGKREMLLLEKTGVDLAFSVEPNVVRSDTDPLAIPRIGSMNRIKLGYLGFRLPSLSNQVGIRKQIAKHLL